MTSKGFAIVRLPRREPAANAPARDWPGPAALVSFAAPFLLVFQPLLPLPLEWLTIYGRLILAPLLVALLLPRTQTWPALLALVALVVSTGYEAVMMRGNDFAILFCSLVGSVVLFRFGAWAAPRRDWSSVWRALVIGVSLANALTLLTYLAVVEEYIDVVALLEALNKVDPSEHGIARFSLGNAIQTPFMLSALLYAGIVSGGQSDRGHLWAATLNLATAVMSQSRLVIVISLLLFGREFIRSGGVARALTAAALVAVLAYSWDPVQAMFESIGSRFGGEDFGSTDDRLFLFQHVVSGLTPLQILVGDGLTAGAEYMRRTRGEYRTVEAVILQLPFEVGVVGILVIAAGAFVRQGSAIPPWRRPTLITLLMWIQCLVFLPIFNLSPVIAVALGALSVKSHREVAARRELARA